MSDQEEERGTQPQAVPPDIEKAHPQAKAQAPLDWDGDNDPENPWNWSKAIRLYHIIPPAIISFAA